MKPERSLPHSQTPAISPYPERSIQLQFALSL